MACRFGGAASDSSRRRTRRAHSNQSNHDSGAGDQPASWLDLAVERLDPADRAKTNRRNTMPLLIAKIFVSGNSGSRRK
jgi:hypothetical protein